MSSRTARRRVLRVALPGPAAPAGPGGAGGAAVAVGEKLELSPGPDMLAAEEPLEIRVNGRAVAVTMRTPGDDIDLAAGFLATEGLIGSAADIAGIRICHQSSPGNDGPGNVAEVTLAGGAVIDDDRLRRNFLTTSACGVCGKASIDAVRVRARFDVAADTTPVSPAVLATLPGALRAAQRVFASTGGLHAAGVFGADGTLLVLREDVGRHNAVDKVAGWALRDGRLPLAGCVLLVSGRASFELVQKAFIAGIPVLAAVSAPSSLAAEFAEEAGMTLVGFLRGRTMNVYTGAARLTGEADG
ncbi:MAG TPA: formate dehydrogenase accessory sulfurtransferase FdhD [Streptosporangiaceae bacterium]|jgi:FdhD protein